MLGHPAPPLASPRRPAAALLALAALLACASGALAAGQHLPVEGCCPDHAKTITQLQTQLRTLQNQLTTLQRTVQPLLNVKTQLVQVRRGFRAKATSDAARCLRLRLHGPCMERPCL